LSKTSKWRNGKVKAFVREKAQERFMKQGFLEILFFTVAQFVALFFFRFRTPELENIMLGDTQCA
jgi:hypothetical protein